MVAWRRDGQELFYFAPDRGIMSVSVSTSPAFEFGKPKLLFKAPSSFPVSGTPGGLASISRDGQRFLGLSDTGQTQPGMPGSPQFHVVLNWMEELQARVPVK